MRLEGTKAESVVGILFWAVKSMVLVDGTNTSNESGLKPFVYQKAKSGLKVWGSDSAKKLLMDLAHAPQKARGQGVDLFNELELIVLN